VIHSRNAYLPLLGVVAAVAAGCLSLGTVCDERWGISPSKLQRAVLGLSVIILLGLGVRTIVRNEDWQDNERLWASAIKACPDSFKVYKGLGTSICGDPARLDEAIQAAEQGLARLDEAPLPLIHTPSGLYLDLGRYYGRKADEFRIKAGSSNTLPSEARAYYEKAVAILQRAVEVDRAVNRTSRESRLARGIPAGDIADVGMPDVYHVLAQVQTSLGRRDEALESLRYECHLEPTRVPAYVLMAQIQAAEGGTEESVVNFLQAIVMGSKDEKVWKDMSEVFKLLDRRVPALVQNGNVVGLNFQNQLLRKELNRACHQLVEFYLGAKRPDQAQEVKVHAIQQFQCPPTVFEDLFPAERQAPGERPAP
jgi:tetratricopeptide (TPR) repeat protein